MRGAACPWRRQGPPVSCDLAGEGEPGMRLICPNCGAQYDVPSGAIPPDGRDVQCSACGKVWFERPSGDAPDDGEPSEPWDEVPVVSDDEEEADDLAEAKAAPPPRPLPARSSVTPEVAEILRSEAARETQVRGDPATKAATPVLRPPAAPAEDIAPPSPQSPAPAAAPAAASPAPAEERGERTDPEPLPEPARSLSRPAAVPERELDLDQINASLRASSGRTGAKPPQVDRRPRGQTGFATGFWGALLVLAVLAGLYVIAPSIVRTVPALGAVLDPYVAAVDDVRLWLDRRVGTLLGSEEAPLAE